MFPAYSPDNDHHHPPIIRHYARQPFHGYDTFLTSHEAFVLEFEQALQAVNPSIAAPYWDYSIDTTLYGHVGNIAEESAIFSHAWFGPLDNSATNDVIESRYFTDLPVPQDRDAPEHNGYGFVTDSVNPNPAAFVTRANSICGLPTKSMLAGCTEIGAVFEADNLDALRSQIELVFHARIHMAIGGVTDCPYSLLDAVSDAEGSTGATFGGSKRADLFEAIGEMANTIWRSLELESLMRCDQECDSTAASRFSSSSGPKSGETLAAAKECSCSCPTVDKTWHGDKESYANAYKELERAGVTQMLLSQPSTSAFFETSAEGATKLAGGSEDENHAFWKWLLDFSCHPGFMGQYATPLASNNDPIFWVTHAVWGRFWHFIRLAPDYESSFHGDWTDPTTKSWMDGYTNTSDCENMLKYDDKLPFKGFTAQDETSGRHYSNHELYDLFAPNNPNLPYIYADFNWDHCDGSADWL